MRRPTPDSSSFFVEAEALPFIIAACLLFFYAVLSEPHSTMKIYDCSPILEYVLLANEYRRGHLTSVAASHLWLPPSRCSVWCGGSPRVVNVNACSPPQHTRARTDSSGQYVGLVCPDYPALGDLFG